MVSQKQPNFLEKKIKLEKTGIISQSELKTCLMKAKNQNLDENYEALKKKLKKQTQKQLLQAA